MASPAGSQYVHKACQQMGAWSGLNILVDSCVDFGYKNSIDQPPPTPADNMAVQIIVGFGNVTLNLKPLGFGASPLLFHTLAAWFLSQAQVKMLLMLPMVQEWPDTWIVTVVTTFLKTSVHRRTATHNAWFAYCTLYCIAYRRRCQRWRMKLVRRWAEWMKEWRSSSPKKSSLTMHCELT